MNSEHVAQTAAKLKISIRLHAILDGLLPPKDVPVVMILVNNEHHIRHINHRNVPGSTMINQPVVILASPHYHGWQLTPHPTLLQKEVDTTWGQFIPFSHSLTADRCFPIRGVKINRGVNINIMPLRNHQEPFERNLCHGRQEISQYDDVTVDIGLNGVTGASGCGRKHSINTRHTRIICGNIGNMDKP
ncbi:MAG: hypothetical protein WCL44_00405 [bacterium]